MNRVVEIFDWAATIVGAIMAVNLAVVALILSFYLDEAPRYRAEMPLLLQSALLFGLLGGSGLMALVAMRRGHGLRFVAQGAVLLCVTLLAMFISEFLST